MTIVLPGIPPSKKNSKQIIYSKKLGRNIIISSKEYTIWERDNLKLLPSPHNFDHVQVTIKFFPKDYRRWDLTNKAESVMDLLVKGQIITDDRWSVCPEVTLKIGEVDKVNPRCVIIIDKIDTPIVEDLTLQATLKEDELTDEAVKL